MIMQFGSLIILVLILSLGIASAIYSVPSQGSSSSASQASPYFTPMPVPTPQSSPSQASSYFISASSPVPLSSPSLVSSQPTYPVQQGPQAFNRNPGFWNQAFEKQDVFYDNINRVGFCPRGRSNFERCPAYPIFDYPFYQQARSGSLGLRFWR